MSDQKLRIDRTTAPGLTMLAFHGVVDAGFEGNKVASSVKTDKLIVNMREVRRFASWGMAEWMNFLRGTNTLDVYFIECSTYAVQQMNLVTGLLGHGKLVSFYTPFRCNSCGEEVDTLVVVAQSRDQLAELANSERTCSTCGGTSRMGKYPADVASAIAARSGYDVDDDVAAFLRSNYKYEIAPNLSKFRAFMRRTNEYTYLRLSGNAVSMAPDVLARAARRTTVVDLTGLLFESERLDAWRAFVTAASANVDSLQLLHCPLGFLESAVTTGDLEGKVKIRSFVHQYDCIACGAKPPMLVDVAEHLEELTSGALPHLRCSSCKADMLPPPAPTLVQRLPARERDPELERFLDKVRQEPDGKLENALSRRREKEPKPAGVARSVFWGSAVAAVIVGGIAVVVSTWSRSDPPPPKEVPAGSAQPAFQRPDWIVSDTPSSAFCQDVVGRLTCVGVSTFHTDRDAAAAEANDAALDELVNTIGLRITDTWFRDNVVPPYSAARTKLLAATATNTTGPALDSVRAVRKRVVEALRASGGAAVPPQRADWYWEEYAKGSGGTEFLVFVRYDITADAIKALVDRYEVKTTVGATTIGTAFPGLAWVHPAFSGGVQVIKPADRLGTAGVTSMQVIGAVGNEPANDPSSLAKALTSPTDVVITVTSGEAPRTITLKP